MFRLPLSVLCMELFSRQPSPSSSSLSSPVPATAHAPHTTIPGARLSAAHAPRAAGIGRVLICNDVIPLGGLESGGP